MLKKEAHASNTVISSILVAGIIITLIGFVSLDIAQGQVNTSSSLISQQKVAICSPSNPKLKFVNSTESEICGITASSTPASNTTRPTNGKQSPLPSSLSLYDQGYAKGVSDAKLVLTRFPSSSTMTPDDVDCDSSVDPQMTNQQYCLGYQHGFADTINNQILGK
jgi:hypothetical protein